MELEFSWEQVKNFLDTKQLKCQWVEFQDTYYVSGIDGVFTVFCKIDKASSEAEEFEASYKAAGNVRVDQRDSEGAQFFMPKYAPTGWSYEAHPVEFETSVVDSIYSKDEAGNNYGWATIKLYDASNNLITDQSTADLSCVKTVIDWEPTVDYLIVAGRLYAIESPSTDVRVWVIGVPDIPFAYGGSRRFVGGVNLKYINSKSSLTTDGKAPKRMNYSATNHTNKFRYILKHDPGIKCKIMIINDIYKA